MAHACLPILPQKNCISTHKRNPFGASAGMVEVRRPQWVSDLVPEEQEGAWRLVGRGRDQGLYSAVVIAHNGKCANRLAAPAGIPQVGGAGGRAVLCSYMELYAWLDYCAPLRCTGRAVVLCCTLQHGGCAL